jgi:F-type H+-transporting ATPase subunit b
MEIQPLQILFQIINFSVVLGALSYLLYKPILKIMDERARRIEEGQVAADKAVAEQSQAEEMKKQIKQKAEKEAAKILDEAQKEAQTKRATILAQAKEEALQEVDRLRTAWQDEKRKSVKEMKAQFTDAVIATSEKVINESVNAKTHSKLIDDEFDQLLKVV